MKTIFIAKRITPCDCGIRNCAAEVTDYVGDNGEFVSSISNAIKFESYGQCEEIINAFLTVTEGPNSYFQIDKLFSK